MFVAQVVFCPCAYTLFPARKVEKMARTHGNKEFSALVRQIEKIGFRVEKTKSGVYKMYPPQSIGGRIYITHGTPKAIKAIKAEFRKIYGVDLSEA